jgi:glutaminyl-peptide cyclotransferase
MGGGGISDDHLPFMGKGVEVLHVIPSPFPDVWHTMEDDGAHLDMATVRDWGVIVSAFVLEWLDMMEVWDEPGEEGKRRRGWVG